MSYQFEDESALEELLNQQLDRRKPKPGPTRPVSSRPGTSTSGARNISSSSSQFRPSTASNIQLAGTSFRQDATQIESTPPTTSKNKLSAWLEGGGGSVSNAQRPALPPPQEPAGDNIPISTRSVAPSQPTVGPVNYRATISGQQIDYLQQANKDDDAEIDSLLTAGNLQEMSKQRLIQLLLERVAPRLSELAQVASKQSAAELDRLAQALQTERARSQVLELRHEEQLKLEQQRASQLSGQLEARLVQAECELAKTMDSQRAHLERLDEQYKKSLSALNESYAQRMRDDKLRFDEMLRARDDMHKLEIESKLTVSCNLIKLDTIQGEWRQTLTSTIEQLEGHFKSVESLLDKQTLQVKGTNSELAAKTRQLCDQHDKMEAFTSQLSRVARQMDELLPEFLRSHRRSEELQSTTNATLEVLNKKLVQLSAREVELDATRANLEGTRAKLDELKLQLALDTARVQLKEERLDETLKSAEEREHAAASQRTHLLEQTGQAQIKRVSLDERAADLKEQNYTLHLLRRRLTNQREELIRAQAILAKERESFKSEKAQVSADSKRLVALRARAQRELDQLRRLQRSLVCSLCMGRLFSNAGGCGDADATVKYEHQLELLPLDLNNNVECDDDDVDEKFHRDGKLLGRRVRLADAMTKSDYDIGKKTTTNDGEHFRRPRNVEPSSLAPNDGNGLDRELRLTELESGQLAAETRLPIHKKYDLKGSNPENREASEKERGKDLPCFKDNDFIKDGAKLYLDSEGADKLINTLEADTAFLAKENLIDYSLCLGIHDCTRYQQEMVEVNSPKSTSSNDEDDEAAGDSGSPKDIGPNLGESMQVDDEIGVISSSSQQAGRQIYFMGLVDVLTQFGLRKRIVTIDPEQYRKKFMEFIVKAIQKAL